MKTDSQTVRQKTDSQTVRQKTDSQTVRQKTDSQTVRQKTDSQTVRQASRLSHDIITKRHLPHYQLLNNYYFITFSTISNIFLKDYHKDCVYNSILFWNNKKYILIACVVMSNHAHIIINPNENLSKIMHSLKSYTAHKINKSLNRNGKLWLEESYDRIIRNENDLNEKIYYIINNPIKAGITNEITEYKWLYVNDWINN